MAPPETQSHTWMTTTKPVHAPAAPAAGTSGMKHTSSTTSSSLVWRQLSSRQSNAHREHSRNCDCHTCIIFIAPPASHHLLCTTRFRAFVQKRALHAALRALIQSPDAGARVQALGVSTDRLLARREQDLIIAEGGENEASMIHPRL